MDPRFVDALVMQAIDATFLHSMDRCKWDPKTLTITTPDDVKREEEMALENAAWYKDEYGEHMSKKDKKDKKKEYAAPEVLYGCLLYTSPSPRDQRGSRMPSSA